MLGRQHCYCVILAGGGGTRLWPLSRAEKPKQFLTLHNGQTLLEHTIERMRLAVEQDHIWLSTTQSYASRITDYMGGSHGGMIVEPALRNTGPSLVLSCLKLYEQDPEAIVMFLPADHFIPSPQQFLPYCERACEYAATSDRILLFGLKPQYPATGYGYIEYDDTVSVTGCEPYSVKKFHEKPSSEVAQQYCEQRNMLWNIGIFCARVTVFIEEFKRLAPDVYTAVVDYHHGHGEYEAARSISVDHMIMEISDRVSVFPVTCEWVDVGTLEPFLALRTSSDGFIPARVVNVDSKDNVVYVNDTLVALVGVENLCVVQAGDTLLIVQRDHMHKVTNVVQSLKKSGSHEYL